MTLPHLIPSPGPSDPDRLLAVLRVRHGDVHQVAAQHRPVPHSPLQLGLRTPAGPATQLWGNTDIGIQQRNRGGVSNIVFTVNYGEIATYTVYMDIEIQMTIKQQQQHHRTKRAGIFFMVTVI